VTTEFCTRCKGNIAEPATAFIDPAGEYVCEECVTPTDWADEAETLNDARYLAARRLLA